MSQTTSGETKTAKLELDGKTYELPMIVGSEQEQAFDISKLRAQTGTITLDSGYGNTGSCQSNITFIDGEKGILRYRGYPIEQLAENSTFVETAWLVIWGELPTAAQLKRFSGLLTQMELIHEDLKYHFAGFPPNAHPMAILSSMINAMSCFQPHMLELEAEDRFEEAVARLLSKVRTIAAYSHKKSIGQPFIYPNPEYSYCANFLHMMFSIPNRDYVAPKEVIDALNLLLVLHADHEQNCSTSTVRMVGSSGANLFASVSAGVCALWGPLHGGANMAVIGMLDKIHRSGVKLQDYIAKVKEPDSKERLMGFGHRVYKSFDPRAAIIKQSCDKVLAKLGVQDPLLDLAKQLEEVALHDEYFVKRNLYPNVDFYSGIIMKAIGIPLNMFTVMFAIGRMPGWIANWREVHQDPKGRIYRPRQIYTGPTQRDYVPKDKRG
jgi:citrate synthase